MLLCSLQAPKQLSDWRPAMGYENVDVTPLPAHPTTNQLVQPCFVPSGMSTEPLNFPNLVTGFEVQRPKGLFFNVLTQCWFSEKPSTCSSSSFIHSVHAKRVVAALHFNLQ